MLICLFTQLLDDVINVGKVQCYEQIIEDSDDVIVTIILLIQLYC